MSIHGGGMWKKINCGQVRTGRAYLPAKRRLRVFPLMSFMMTSLPLCPIVLAACWSWSPLTMTSFAVACQRTGKDVYHLRAGFSQAQIQSTKFIETQNLAWTHH